MEIEEIESLEVRKENLKKYCGSVVKNAEGGVKDFEAIFKNCHGEFEIIFNGCHVNFRIDYEDRGYAIKPGDIIQCRGTEELYLFLGLGSINQDFNGLSPLIIREKEFKLTVILEFHLKEELFEKEYQKV